MKEILCLLQNKIKSITCRNNSIKPPPAIPFNECSKTLVSATSNDSINNNDNKPSLKLGTSLPLPPWEGLGFVQDRPIQEEDITHLKYLIKLIKDIHECQNEQFTFFQNHSVYLQMNCEVIPNRLCLYAPSGIIKEQQDLLDREKALNLEFQKKKYFKKKTFWKQFRHSSTKRFQSEIEAEYASLQRIFTHLANDNTTKLKVISFLTVVFSCRTGLVGELTG